MFLQNKLNIFCSHVPNTKCLLYVLHILLYMYTKQIYIIISVDCNRLGFGFYCFLFVCCFTLLMWFYTPIIIIEVENYEFVSVIILFYLESEKNLTTLIKFIIHLSCYLSWGPPSCYQFITTNPDPKITVSIAFKSTINCMNLFFIKF